MPDIIEQYKRRINQLERKLNNFESAVKELELLNEIAVTAGRTNGIDQTLKLILNKTVAALNAEHGAILLVSENQEILKTLIKKDNNSKVAQKPGISKHITGWVLLNKKSLLIKELKTDHRFKTTKYENENIKSLICSPIWYEGKIIGILQLINKKSNNNESFSENDLTLLSIISVQAGQLIKNSELQNLNYEKMKEIAIARLETEKLQELNKLKTDFFTNISHEFRTPLTLILGPLEKLLDRDKNSDNQSDYKTIYRNAKNLLGLINQLLDLSKLDAGKLKLQAANGNIVSFVKGVTMSFESLAIQKGINLKFSASNEDIEIYFDRDKLSKILINLLSNAFKFTLEEGTIIVSITERHAEFISASFPKREIPGQTRNDNMKEFVQVKIKDSGIGISEKELPNLFDRFYQVNNSESQDQTGTGIGLALTKELVELHHGYIKVKSKIEEGSEFIIGLPIAKEHFNENEIFEKPIEDKKEFKVNNNDIFISPELIIKKVKIDDIENEKIILVVEDNSDVRKFIKDSLKESYKVEEAINGEDGINKAKEIVPDLIISDVMMPKMDGNGLTERIKNDERTSHVPVILLTAKSEQKSKLEGLETGADDYLTKPFNTKELLVRIKNLIDLRKKLQEKYSNIDYVSKLNKKRLSTPDENFMNKVMQVIESHMSEENFSIQEFDKELEMGSVQIYRKLKALTGKSPSQYIRTIRLVKARKMIIEKQGTISEISYSVGFSTPQYFTKCFREEFNYLPSKLIKSTN